MGLQLFSKVAGWQPLGTLWLEGATFKICCHHPEKVEGSEQGLLAYVTLGLA